MKNKIILILTLLVSVYLLFNHFATGSDEERIREKFEQLEELVSKSSAENMFSNSLKADTIGQMFTENSTLEIPVKYFVGNFSRNTLSSRVADARTQFRTISLEFHDLSVDLLESEATVILTADFIGQLDGKPINMIEELEFKLVKSANEWLINSVTAVEVLKR